MHTQQDDMNMNPIDSGTFMTILTTGFYVITVLTNGIFGMISSMASLIQGFAGIAAILAGFSTVAYNCYKFYNDYKKNKQQNKKE